MDFNLVGYVQMEIVKENRKYLFYLPWGAPFAECHEVAAKFVSNVIELQKQEEEKLKAQQTAQQDQSEAIDPEVVS